jgi:hypothetical protein
MDTIWKVAGDEDGEEEECSTYFTRAFASTMRFRKIWHRRRKSDTHVADKVVARGLGGPKSNSDL